MGLLYTKNLYAQPVPVNLYSKILISTFETQKATLRWLSVDDFDGKRRTT